MLTGCGDELPWLCWDGVGRCGGRGLLGSMRPCGLAQGPRCAPSTAAPAPLVVGPGLRASLAQESERQGGFLPDLLLEEAWHTYVLLLGLIRQGASLELDSRGDDVLAVARIDGRLFRGAGPGVNEALAGLRLRP